MSKPQTLTIRRDGESIYVVREGQGPPVVFGHGLTFSHRMWQAQAEALREEYTVIRLDFRGHGETRGGLTPFTLYDLADDVVAILDHFEIPRCTYVGFSMGGMVGVRLLKRHPGRIEGMAFLCTTASPEPPERREMYAALNEKTRGKDPDRRTVEFVLSLMFSESFRKEHPEIVEQFFQELYRKNDEGMYHATRAVIERDDLDPFLPSVRVPSLVIVSEEDMAVPPELGRRLAEGIPGATLVSIGGAGHMVPVEKAELVNEHLRSFLSTIYSP